MSAFHDYWKDADIFDCDMVSAEMIFDEGISIGERRGMERAAEIAESDSDLLKFAISRSVVKQIAQAIRKEIAKGS